MMVVDPDRRCTTFGTSGRRRQRGTAASSDGEDGACRGTGVIHLPPRRCSSVVVAQRPEPQRRRLDECLSATSPSHERPGTGVLHALFG